MNCDDDMRSWGGLLYEADTYVGLALSLTVLEASQGCELALRT